MKQLYLDFVAPIKATGAIQNKRGDWHMPNEPGRAFHAQEFLRQHGLEPARLDPPATRTMAAIRRKYGNGPENRTPGDKEWQAMRATQYMAWLNGAETPFQNGRYSQLANVRFDKAPDGSRRVRYVLTDVKRDWQELPHWDFVPTVEDLSDEFGRVEFLEAAQ